MLNEAPEDIEEVLVAWLSPVHPTAITRPIGDPLPFIVIRHIDGTESVDEGTADHLVTIRTFCEKALGDVAARDACNLTHRRMLKLAHELPDVPLANGRNASIDYVTVTESPRWDEYADDQVLVKRARYQVGLSYVLEAS